MLFCKPLDFCFNVGHVASFCLGSTLKKRHHSTDMMLQNSTLAKHKSKTQPVLFRTAEGTSAKLGFMETIAKGFPTVESESNVSTQGIRVHVFCALGNWMPEMFSSKEDLPADCSPTTTTPGSGISTDWQTWRTLSNKPSFFETSAIVFCNVSSASGRTIYSKLFESCGTRVLRRLSCFKMTCGSESIKPFTDTVADSISGEGESFWFLAVLPTSSLCKKKGPPQENCGFCMSHCCIGCG